MVYNYVIEKIQSCDDITIVRDIANSVNKNQVKNKKWLIKYLQPYLDMYTDCKILVAAGWHGLAAHFIDRNVIFQSSEELDIIVPYCARYNYCIWQGVDATSLSNVFWYAKVSA